MICKKEQVEHFAVIKELETCARATQALKNEIEEVVKETNFSQINDDITGFLNLTPLQKSNTYRIMVGL